MDSFKKVTNCKCKICGKEVDFTERNSIGYLTQLRSKTWNPSESETPNENNILSEVYINFPKQIEICIDCYRKEEDLLDAHIYTTYEKLNTGKGNHDNVSAPIRL